MNSSYLRCWLLVLAFCSCLSETAPAAAGVDFSALDRQLAGIVTNVATTDPELLEAISRLGKVTESAEFWTKIANDPQYSTQHRRRAVFALFRRHCSDKHTFRELARVIKQPTWLQKSQITRFDTLAGNLPILIEGGVVYRIAVLGGPGIYLRVSKDLDQATFTRLISGEAEALSRSNPEIFQYGFDDDYESWLLNRNYRGTTGETLQTNGVSPLGKALK